MAQPRQGILTWSFAQARQQSTRGRVSQQSIPAVISTAIDIWITLVARGKSVLTAPYYLLANSA